MVSSTLVFLGLGLLCGSLSVSGQSVGDTLAVLSGSSAFNVRLYRDFEEDESNRRITNFIQCSSKDGAASIYSLRVLDCEDTDVKTCVADQDCVSQTRSKSCPYDIFGSQYTPNGVQTTEFEWLKSGRGIVECQKTAGNSPSFTRLLLTKTRNGYTFTNLVDGNGNFKGARNPIPKGNSPGSDDEGQFGPPPRSEVPRGSSPSQRFPASRRTARPQNTLRAARPRPVQTFDQPQRRFRPQQFDQNPNEGQFGPPQQVDQFGQPLQQNTQFGQPQPQQVDQFGRPLVQDQFGQPLQQNTQFGQPQQVDQFGQPLQQTQFGQPQQTQFGQPQQFQNPQTFQRFQ